MDIEWADLILVMERKPKSRIKEIFDIRSSCRIESLDIPDEYEYMDDGLIQIIRDSTEPYLSTSA